MSNGVHVGVRKGHEARILRLLSDHGALSRANLAELADLSRVSLAGITADLIEREAIVVVPPAESKHQGRGRPPEKLTLNPRAGALLGVEFGHRRIHVAVVNAAHEIIVDGAVPHSEDLAWDARVTAAFELIDALGAEAGMSIGHLAAIGLGVVGPVGRNGLDIAPRSDGQFALSAGTIDAMRSAFSDRYGTTVLVDNNARLATLAEAGWGAGPSTTDLLYVRISGGVGGGLVVDGRLIGGSLGLAGHIGHVTVRPDGNLCRCGKRGCLETLVSVPNLVLTCQQIVPSIETLADITRAVEAGNDAIRDCLVLAGEALGGVLATLAVGLNPAEIVISGDLMLHDRIVFDTATTTLAGQLPPTQEYSPLIRPGRLGDGDGALGAIIAAFRRSPLLAAYTNPLTAEIESPAAR